MAVFIACICELVNDDGTATTVVNGEESARCSGTEARREDAAALRLSGELSECSWLERDAWLLGIRRSFTRWESARCDVVVTANRRLEGIGQSVRTVSVAMNPLELALLAAERAVPRSMPSPAMSSSNATHLQQRARGFRESGLRRRVPRLPPWRCSSHTYRAAAIVRPAPPWQLQFDLFIFNLSASDSHRLVFADRPFALLLGPCPSSKLQPSRDSTPLTLLSDETEDRAGRAHWPQNSEEAETSASKCVLLPHFSEGWRTKTAL